MKTRVGILVGGYSAEAHISVKSGKVVARSIANNYNPILIEVSKSGWTVLEDDRKYDVDLTDLTYQKDGHTLGFDVFFNAIHGTPGEDGKIQTLLDQQGALYTGSSAKASSISFDKGRCNTFLKDFEELNVPKSTVLSRNSEPDVTDLIKTIGLPCFVKPSNAGSSYGISKVNSMEELLPAIQHAFEYDSSVLVEQFINGTEVSNGVYSIGGEIHSLPVTEIIPKGSFFDYNAKYEGGSKEITPARLSPELTSSVQQMARKVFKLLGLNGMARVDFIIENETPYLIEPNTVPGLSAESILPQQVREAGMTLGEFFGLLIQDTLDQAN